MEHIDDTSIDILETHPNHNNKGKEVESNFVPKKESKFKRYFDVIVSIVLLVISLPIFVIVSLLIKFTSKGPIFFVQERLGKDRVPFNLYKFRTMVPNAEKNTGPVWASEDDPRITPIGQFLRTSRIDELPQLYNVIKGEMSIVGCRPIRQHFADLLAEEIPDYNFRFVIKPGLTGLAQVSDKYANTKQAQKRKLKYDLLYIRRRNFYMDIKILLLTLLIPFKSMGL